MQAAHYREISLDTAAITKETTKLYANNGNFQLHYEAWSLCYHYYNTYVTAYKHLTKCTSRSCHWHLYSFISISWSYPNVAVRGKTNHANSSIFRFIQCSEVVHNPFNVFTLNYIGVLMLSVKKKTLSVAPLGDSFIRVNNYIKMFRVIKKMVWDFCDISDIFVTLNCFIIFHNAIHIAGRTYPLRCSKFVWTYFTHVLMVLQYLYYLSLSSHCCWSQYLCYLIDSQAGDGDGGRDCGPTKKLPYCLVTGKFALHSGSGYRNFYTTWMEQTPSKMTQRDYGCLMRDSWGSGRCIRVSGFVVSGWVALLGQWVGSQMWMSESVSECVNKSLICHCMSG